MESQKHKLIGLGILALIVIVLGLKFVPVVVVNLSRPYEDTAVLLQLARTQIAQRPTDAAPITAVPLPDLSGKPFLLFFYLDKPCECMKEITQKAERQMAAWPVERQGGVTVLRLGMETYTDLETKYQVVRSPGLVLLDSRGKIVWRQDYPLIEGGPFKLDELEAAIAALGND